MIRGGYPFRREQSAQCYALPRLRGSLGYEASYYPFEPKRGAQYDGRRQPKQLQSTLSAVPDVIAMTLCVGFDQNWTRVGGARHVADQQECRGSFSRLPRPLYSRPRRRQKSRTALVKIGHTRACPLSQNLIYWFVSLSQSKRILSGSGRTDLRPLA